MKTLSEINSIVYVVTQWFSELIHSRTIQRYLLCAALFVCAFVLSLLAIAVLRHGELHTVSTQVVSLLHQLGLPFGSPYPS